MNIIIFGAPGSGKGTQAKKLSLYYNIPHISTGDILRNNININTSYGKKIKEYIDNGFLVPDEILVEIIKERLDKEDCKSGYILDGYPRTLNQAKQLEIILNKLNKNIEFIFNIEILKEVLLDRLSSRMICNCGYSYNIKSNQPKISGICDNCGSKLISRDDDNPKSIEKRIDIYEKQKKPLLEYYNQKKVLYNINGSLSINEIFNFIKNICDNK